MLRSRCLPPAHSVHPIGHLRLIVDSEEPDRPSGFAVDIDDQVQHARVGPQARRPVEKRAAIGLNAHGKPARIRANRTARVRVWRITAIPLLAVGVLGVLLWAGGTLRG